MRHVPILLFALLAGACADHAPPPHRGPPPGGFGGGDFRRGPHGPGGPDGPGSPGGGRFLFISPMGEPFRVESPDLAWFNGADANHDGKLDRAEFRADALRFFKVLDREGDGEIDPGDIDVYENQLVPEIRVRDGGGGGGGPAGDDGGGRRGGGGRGGSHGGGMGGGPGGGGMGGGPGGGGGGPEGGEDSGGGGSHASTPSGAQGAARFGYLDLPEPVTSADRNFNRGVDITEFLIAADARFALLDRNGDGVLTRDELPKLNTHAGPMGRGPRHRG